MVSVYRPAGATAESPVPVILHSHGWGGSRTTSATAFKTELDAGYGVVSIDQRGHGASGGEANVEDPELEGQDMISVIDYVAAQPWVAKDTDTGHAGDPVLFAMGGSYGGGYQFVAAFTELRDLGYTRLNAIAPEITWFNLSEALAPQKVVRTAWVTALYAAGAPMLPQYIHEAFAYGAATGQWPDGTVAQIPNLQDEFFKHGPSGSVAAGRLLDIPVLFGQGLTDNLFNLNQGWKNMELALTPGARGHSLFVGYNGGHALPNALPLGTTGGGDVCSGDGGFAGLRMRFFNAILAGEETGTLLPARYNLSTQGGDCIRSARLDQRTAYPDRCGHLGRSRHHHPDGRRSGAEPPDRRRTADDQRHPDGRCRGLDARRGPARVLRDRGRRDAGHGHGRAEQRDAAARAAAGHPAAPHRSSCPASRSRCPRGSSPT